MRRHLVLLAGRCFFHFGLEPLDEVTVPALEKEFHVLYGFLVLRKRCQAVNTRAEAAMDVILQARPGTLPIDRDVAIADQKVSLDQLQGLSREARRKKRTEVQRPILAHAPRNDGARKWLVRRQLDERVRLVVTQQDVVLRLVLLDEVILERQRLAFRVRHDELEILDGVHHLILAFVQVPRILKVRPHTIP